MTVTEILPILKILSHSDKLRAIQFLADELIREDEIFIKNQEFEFISQTDAFEASQLLVKLIEERKTNWREC